MTAVDLVRSKHVTTIMVSLRIQIHPVMKASVKIWRDNIRWPPKGSRSSPNRQTGPGNHDFDKHGSKRSRTSSSNDRSNPSRRSDDIESIIVRRIPEYNVHFAVTELE